MSRSLGIVLGLAAVAGGVLLFVWAGGGKSASNPQARPDSPAATRPTGDAPATPRRARAGELPAPAPTVGPPRPRPQLQPTAPTQTFETETRDSTWAVAVEHEIEARLEPLLDKAGRDLVSVVRVECRHHRCQLMIRATDERAFAGFVEALQSERGFYGYADNLVLSKVEQSSGAAEMRVFLVFDRD